MTREWTGPRQEPASALAPDQVADVIAQDCRCSAGFGREQLSPSRRRASSRVPATRERGSLDLRRAYTQDNLWEWLPAGRAPSSTSGGNIELEQLDDAGREWFAEGPGGDAIGGRGEGLAAVIDDQADPAWITVVTDTIERELASARRSMLLVKRVTGRWFHATFAENRSSILRHGLDHRRMTSPGIAGSTKPEAAGVFLCCDLEGAHWFARMGRRGPVDVWGADLVDVRLIGDPGAGSGGDETWMICPERIEAAQLTLIEKDIIDSWTS